MQKHMIFEYEKYAKSFTVEVQFFSLFSGMRVQSQKLLKSTASRQVFIKIIHV